MEVESQWGELSLITLDNTFQQQDMERNVSPLDWKKDGVVFVVDVNHVFL